MKKYNSIDLTKFIMAFLVIATHTHPLEQDKSELYSVVIRMAVPIFFLASGFFLAMKIQNAKNNNEDYIGQIKSYLIKIVKMYVIWSIIYLPLAIYGYILDGTSFPYAILLYIRGFFFIGEHYNSWPLWYLLSTIYALVFILLCYKKNISIKKIVFVGLCISMISFSLNSLVTYEGQLPNLLLLLQKIVKYSISSGRILQGCIYIPLGIYIQSCGIERFSKIKNYIIFIVGLLLNIIIKNSFISSYLLLITSVALFGIVTSIKLKDSIIYPMMRKMSTIIYLIHMYIYTFYYLIVYKQETYGIDCFIVTSIISFILSFLYVVFNYRIKAKLNKN